MSGLNFISLTFIRKSHTFVLENGIKKERILNPFFLNLLNCFCFGVSLIDLVFQYTSKLL